MNQRSLYYALFHPKPLARRVNSFGFPRDLADRFEIIQKWLNIADDKTHLDAIAEAQFLHDIFVDLLGYKSPFETNGDAWELELYPHPMLGFFTGKLEHPIVEVSFRAAEDGAIVKPEPKHETTEWLVVWDYREVCLYHRQVSSLFCQRFTWAALADLEQLKSFYFLLSRRTLLRGIANSEERSRTTQLLEESHQLESEVLKNFYSHYYKIRSQLIKDFRYRVALLSQVAPNIAPSITPNITSSNGDDYPQANIENTVENAIEIAIYQAQKLLNRVIFVACCASRGYLPANLIKDAYEFVNPYIEQPVWENYKAIFRWVQQGNPNYAEPIHAHSSLLFASDRLLDQALFVGDELCRQIKEITRFDFREDITRHILICLFDESIRELSQYRKDIGNLSKRRTPKLPCKSILHSEAVIRLLQQHLQQDLHQDLQVSTKTTEFPDQNPKPEFNDNFSDNKNENAAELALDDLANYSDNPQPSSTTFAYIQAYQLRLLNIKILHPRCGAGVFLMTALEFLMAEHERIQYLLAKFPQDPQAIATIDDSGNEQTMATEQINSSNPHVPMPRTPSEIVAHILQHNLFGCDVVEESVELTRLSLYLRSLEVDHNLPSFEQNIQLGEPAQCDFGKDFQLASDRGEVLILR